MTNHKSFIFGDTLENQLAAMPDKEQLQFRKAISDFGLYGKEPDFSEWHLKTIWSGMRDLISNLNRKHWASQANGQRHTAGNDNLSEPTGTYPNLSEPTGTYGENLPIGKGNRLRAKDKEHIGKTGECVSENPLAKLFLDLWEENSDVFNQPARIIDKAIWTEWWESSENTFTEAEIRTAIENFCEGVKSGAIERRWIPGTPDRFVLNGHIQRSQEPYADSTKQDSHHHIANDEVGEGVDLSEYFTE